ncbi:LEF-4 [Mythimna sequax nucleopolyhedrovirus]|nr:LEF-4 [Mythimna sequax nucleopolyhedrovirus]
MAMENEISYSINLSQDLLYIILDSYISKKFQEFEEYFDFTDKNNIRTRLINSTKFSSVKKTCISLDKIVYAHRDVLVPFVNRKSVEEPVQCPHHFLRRIIKCKVFKSDDCPECEIKFEHVYKNQSLIDKCDAQTAAKQIQLYNTLKNTNENLVKESHLGSDEIMASIRLEYEYVDRIDEKVLAFMSKIIQDIDSITAHQNISPLLPYTTLQNNIIYRKFEDEHLIYDMDNTDNIHKWALKLDGVRGKGFFTRSFMIVFMDDMQIFSSKFDHKLFTINNVVAFQCELVDNVMYITDLLHVFKYSYNNRTQYEVSLDPYHIAPECAIDCINYFATKYNDGKQQFTLSDCDGHMIQIKFQRFFDAPIVHGGYATMPTDGYVVLNKTMQYVKYKQSKTVEVEYDADECVFKSLTGPLNNRQIQVSPTVGQLTHQTIYEAIVTNNSIVILKHRPDRLVPN